MEMAFEGRHGLGQMLADEVGGEAGPCGKVAIVDGFDPCGRDRVSTWGVEEGDVVNLVGSVVGAVGVVIMWSARSRIPRAIFGHVFVEHVSIVG